MAKRISTNPGKIRKGNIVMLNGAVNVMFAKVLSVQNGIARLDRELLGFHSWSVKSLKRKNVKKIKK